MSEEYEKMKINKLMTEYQKEHDKNEKKFPWSGMYDTKEGLIKKLKN
jgi:hypothetical protein